MSRNSLPTGPYGRRVALWDMIAEGEHQQQDFKYKITDAPKLARSVSAFANTEGGRLLIGVRDDGSIHGVRSEEEIFMMHAAACKYCSPVPTVKFETLHVPTEPHGGHFRTVVICTILPSEHRPVFALEASDDNVGDRAPKRTAYVRIADENIVASPVHLAIWRQEARLYGEAYGDTNEEHALLACLEQHPEGISLNRLLKAVQTCSLPDSAQTSLHIRLLRPQAVILLARFIRFGLASMQRHEQEWLFFSKG